VRLRFGDCVLDSELRELTRGGRAVRLSPKAFLLLEALAERRPRAVGHDELRRLIWPEALVGGTTLARLLNEVRAAIGDAVDAPRFIRTVHRFGYAFCGAAVEEQRVQTAPPRCAVQWGDRLIPLRPGENLIGRAADAAVSIALPRVSRRHARLTVGDGRVVLEDLGSKHGTLLRRQRIEGAVELGNGDEIQIGSVLLIFRNSLEDDATF